jgi:hypothetical protein
MFEMCFREIKENGLLIQDCLTEVTLCAGMAVVTMVLPFLTNYDLNIQTWLFFLATSTCKFRVHVIF